MASPFSRAALLATAAALLSACPGGGGSAPRPEPPAAARPTLSPDVPLRFRDTLEVALATTTAGASIRYTTDGTTPDASSPAYAGPFTIATTTTVKAYAAGPGLADSAVATATFRRRAVDLVLDDGGGEAALGPGIIPSLFPAAVMLNRFTPAAEDFPFQLRRIRVLLTRAAGPLQLVVYSDLLDDPRSGATLLDAYTLSTIAAGGAWTEYDVEPPLTLTGPGDVLLGVLGTSDFECSVDSTAVAHRSWYGIWSAGGNGPPALPPSGGFGVDPYNYLIRGSN